MAPVPSILINNFPLRLGVNIERVPVSCRDNDQHSSREAMNTHPNNPGKLHDKVKRNEQNSKLKKKLTESGVENSLLEAWQRPETYRNCSKWGKIVERPVQKKKFGKIAMNSGIR
jgi:hypothetical protein